MSTKGTETTEADLIRYAADNQNVVNGRGYHKRKRGTRAYGDETVVPYGIASFDPSALLAEIRWHLAQNTDDGKLGTARPELSDRNLGARWYVERLMEITHDLKTPAAARLKALEAIRRLKIDCLAALHEPIEEHAAARTHRQQIEASGTPFSQYIAKQASA